MIKRNTKLNYLSRFSSVFCYYAALERHEIHEKSHHYLNETVTKDKHLKRLKNNRVMST